MIRIGLLVVVWSSVAAAIIGLASRWIDADGVVPVIQSALPVFGLLAVLGLAVAIPLRQPALLATAGTAALAALALAVPSMIPHTVAARDGDEVVMTSNMEFGAGSARAVMDAVRTHRVQTLVLVEVTPEAVRRLDRAGMSAVLPFRVGETRADFRGTLLVSSHRLTEQPVAPSPDGGALMPAVRVATPSGTYLLRGVHTYAPLPDLQDKWRAGMRELQQWQRLQRAAPVVLAGDFNASSAMPVFRRTASDMTDAARESGRGWVRTWPHGRHYPPFVALDHVLSRGFDVVGSGEIDIPDTDHRAVWARLRLH